MSKETQWRQNWLLYLNTYNLHQGVKVIFISSLTLHLEIFLPSMRTWPIWNKTNGISISRSEGTNSDFGAWILDRGAGIWVYFLEWFVSTSLLSGTCRLSCFSRVRLFVTPWTIAHRLLCPWDSPGKNIGVGCHALLQGICPTQGLNPRLLCLLHW